MFLNFKYNVIVSFFALIIVLDLNAAVQKMLLADEGNQKIHFFNLADTTQNWSTSKIDNNRDMQLIGNNRVMVSTLTGFYELDITTGIILDSVKNYSGVLAARRAPNNHIFLARGRIVTEIDTTGKKIRDINLQRPIHRQFRISSSSTFLYGNADTAVEVNDSGKVVWEAKVVVPKCDVFEVFRTDRGIIWVSCGYGKSLVALSKEKVQLKTVTFPDSIKPLFSGGFHFLPGGHIIATNWVGHGTGRGGTGNQVIEIDTATGKVVWKWKQDSTRISSLHGILVIDNLNTNLLHCELNGLVVPVQTTKVDKGHPPKKISVNYGTVDKITLRGQKFEHNVTRLSRQSILIRKWKNVIFEAQSNQN